jgi:hypothetical protein
VENADNDKQIDSLDRFLKKRGMKTMTTLQLQKIDSLLKELPDEKVQLAMNFILWLKQSDEVLTEVEVKKVKKAGKEKSGISWKKLRENV